MNIPFLKRKAHADMTETELEAGIARWDRVLDKRPRLSHSITVATIYVTAAAQMTLVGLAGATAALTVGTAILGGLGIGAACLFGSAYAWRGRLNHALRERNGMTDVFNTKVTTRIAAEQEATRLRNIKATEDFNAAVDAGLPLETDIKVRRALKLRRPEPVERQGFARIKDIFDPRL